MLEIQKQPIRNNGSSELGTLNLPNHLYFTKNRSEIRKLNGNGEISRTYINWQGNSEKYMQLIIPQKGRRGEFTADAYFPNNDSSWTRTRYLIKGIMDEHGNVVKMMKNLSSDGHGNLIPDIEFIRDVLCNEGKYPGTFIRVIKKCLNYINKAK